MSHRNVLPADLYRIDHSSVAVIHDAGYNQAQADKFFLCAEILRGDSLDLRGQKLEKRKGLDRLFDLQFLFKQNFSVQIQQKQLPGGPVKGVKFLRASVEHQITGLAAAGRVADAILHHQIAFFQLPDHLGDRGAADIHSLPYVRSGQGLVLFNIMQDTVSVPQRGIRMRKKIMFHVGPPAKQIYTCPKSQTAHLYIVILFLN